MATVVADMSVSLDGFVADTADRADKVFSWYGKPQPEQSPREPTGEAEAMGLGVIVYGRRTLRWRTAGTAGTRRARRSSS
jgi:hypothetical protein